MALFQNKWEIKTWQELSASVADSSNNLEFRAKHRLPYELQQGSKASKKPGGFFNPESIVKTTGGAFDKGFYIYDTGSGLAYTGIPKAAYKQDMTDFLMSSSLSTAAKTQISASFNATIQPDYIVQLSEATFAPATSSWTLPCGVIGDATKSLVIRNTSTNTTNITILNAGTVTGGTGTVEFTLPMEFMKFTPTFASRSLQFAEFSGSEYSNATYESSSIATIIGGSETTASIIGKNWGSGSFVSWNSLYDQVDHTMQLMALGDGEDTIYSYSAKENVMHFPAGSVVASESVRRYATTDTSMTTILDTPTIYFVTGSLALSGFSLWTGDGIKSGSHIFADENLILPAEEGIYKFATTGYRATIPAELGSRVPQFQSQTYF